MRSVLEGNPGRMRWYEFPNLVCPLDDHDGVAVAQYFFQSDVPRLTKRLDAIGIYMDKMMKRAKWAS